MSEQDPKPTDIAAPSDAPQSAPLSPRIDDLEAKAASSAAELSTPAKPAFQSDAFMSGQASNGETKQTIVKRGGVGFFTAVLLSALATVGGASLTLFALSKPDLMRQAGLGALIAPQATPPSAGTNPANLSPLLSRVDAIEAELVVLKAQVEGRAAAGLPLPASSPSPSLPPASPPTMGAVPIEVGTLKSELAGVGGRVTAIETRIAALDPTGAGGAVIAGLQTEIATLKVLVSGLQSQVAATPSPAVTFAVVNLSEAATRSTPFLTEFEVLRGALPNAPEVIALESYARSGVPTRSVLEERLAVLSAAVLTAEQNAPAEGGILGWFRSLFANMIKIEPANKAEGSSTVEILARAKQKLAEGDLSAGVEEVARIQNAPTDIVSWVNDARKRLELDSRVAALRGAAVRVNVPTPVTLPANGVPQAPAIPPTQSLPSKT